MTVTDQPNTKGDCHAVQCLEYLCAARPKYYKPPEETQEEERWLEKHYQRLRKERRQETKNFINLGL